MLWYDWSSRLESIRKDVECFYGILKRRWKILQYGVRTRDMQSIDHLMLTCCALHNILLSWDELYQTIEPDYVDDDNGPIEEQLHLDEDVVIVPREIPKEDHKSLESKLVAHFTCIKKRGDLNWLR
jgi:hypothetical protein